MVVESICGEYNRYKLLVELAIEQVNDEDLNKVFGEDGNSISILMNHLIGNLKSRFTNFLTEDGEKQWRDRDSEFEGNNLTRDQLLNGWNESFTILFDQIGKVSDDDLVKQVSIRGQKLSVMEALHRSLAHLSYHAGQIVLIARMHVGREWKSLSIPKRKSSEYNMDPTKERKPG
jgi:hypothetical protein